MNKLKRLIQVAANAYWEYKPVWTPQRLTTALGDIDIDRPIFIVGVQGGGLTLLARMIHRKKNVISIGGGRRFWVGNNEMDKQYVGQLPEDFTLRSPEYQSPTFKQHMTGCEYEHPVFGTSRNWTYACDDLVDQYRKTEADWTPEKEEMLKRAMKESIRAYADKYDEVRFLDMSQTFTLKVPLLRTIFPDAKLIVQARNPYAVCLKEAQDESYPWRREADRETKLQIFSEHWANTYRYALKDLNDDDRKTVIKFENLVRRPEKTLRTVLDTADLSYEDDLLPQEHHTFPLGASEQHKWYPIRSGGNQKYLDQLDSQARDVIGRNVDGIADRLGYQPQ
jgi:hypothetical protein